MGSDAHWKKWARTDPYFSVIFDEKFKKINLSDNLSEFFLLGEQSVETLLRSANEFVGTMGNENALDFGCGVGRLTMPLANRFKCVVGIDISEDMLSEARRNCARRGITNAQFALSDDHLAVLQPFDLVITSMVLQHIPRARGMRLLNRLLALVKCDGCAIIHLSLLRPDGPWSRIKYFIKHNIPILDAIRNGLIGKGFSSLTMRMTEYNLADALKLFHAHSMTPLMLLPSYQGDILACYIIAKKIC